MKSNVIKYIFFIAVLIIVGVAIYMIYKDNKSIQKMQKIKQQPKLIKQLQT